MNVFTFVFLLVTVCLVAGLIKTYLQQRNSREDLGPDIEQTLASIDELEQRVRVLERIITEKPVGLRERIDSL